MFDIQPDSPVPVHEQIVTQVMTHVASGSFKPGARLAEYRAMAQHLLTNPQVVARAYGDLEWEGVLKKHEDGSMEVTPNAAVICKVRLQDRALEALRKAVAQARASGLADAAIRDAVDDAVQGPAPLSPEQMSSAIKQVTHATSNRTAQGVEVLPGQEGGGSDQPDHPARGDFRSAR